MEPDEITARIKQALAEAPMVDEMAPTRAYVPAAMVIQTLFKSKWTPTRFFASEFAPNYLFGLVCAFLKIYDVEDHPTRMVVFRRARSLISFDLSNPLAELHQALADDPTTDSTYFDDGWSDAYHWLAKDRLTLDRLMSHLKVAPLAG